MSSKSLDSHLALGSILLECINSLKKHPEGECRAETNKLRTCRKSGQMNTGKGEVQIFK